MSFFIVFSKYERHRDSGHLRAKEDERKQLPKLKIAKYALLQYVQNDAKVEEERKYEKNFVGCFASSIFCYELAATAYCLANCIHVHVRIAKR